MFGFEKATVLYTINSQILTQITCHSYLCVHIELLYLVASRQLAPGNTSWICLLSRNSISHSRRRYYPLLSMGSEIALPPPLYFGQIGSLESGLLAIYLVPNVFIKHNKKWSLFSFKFFSMVTETRNLDGNISEVPTILYILSMEKIFKTGSILEN